MAIMLSRSASAEIYMNAPGSVFGRSEIDVAFGVTFTLLLVSAAVMDVRYRKISNKLALIIVLLGGLFAVISVGPRDAIVRVLEGEATGLLIWMPVWALGKVGAGDVKFFAAACTWLGSRLAVQAALVSAILGGALAICWLCWRSRSKGALVFPVHGNKGRHLESDSFEPLRNAGKLPGTLPYGVAMATGLAITAWFPHLMR